MGRRSNHRRQIGVGGVQPTGRIARHGAGSRVKQDTVVDRDRRVLSAASDLLKGSATAPGMSQCAGATRYLNSPVYESDLDTANICSLPSRNGRPRIPQRRTRTRTAIAGNAAAHVADQSRESHPADRPMPGRNRRCARPHRLTDLVGPRPQWSVRRSKNGPNDPVRN